MNCMICKQDMEKALKPGSFYVDGLLPVCVTCRNKILKQADEDLDEMVRGKKA